MFVGQLEEWHAIDSEEMAAVLEDAADMSPLVQQVRLEGAPDQVRAQNTAALQATHLL